VIHLAAKITDRVKDIKVVIPKQIFDRKDWVKYLIVVEWQRQVIDKTVFEAVTSAKFNDFVHKHVDAYVTDKKMPPAEIEGAILNIADDILSGREPTLRTGDYLALQNYMKRTIKA